MVLPLIIGGLAIAGLFALAKNKDSSSSPAAIPMGIPPAGSVWTFVINVKPALKPTDAQALRAAYGEAMKQTGAEIVDFNAPDPNTLVVTVRYKVQPEYPVLGAGASIKVGPYTITVQSLTQAPAH